MLEMTWKVKNVDHQAQFSDAIFIIIYFFSSTVSELNPQICGISKAVKNTYAGLKNWSDEGILEKGHEATVTINSCLLTCLPEAAFFSFQTQPVFNGKHVEV